MISIDPTAPTTIDADATHEYTVDEVLAQTTEELLSDPTASRASGLLPDAFQREVRTTTTTNGATPSVHNIPAERTALPLERPDTSSGQGQLTPFVPPLPVMPIVLKRAVSARYVGTVPGWRLELRVDVDGARPMKRISGDYYRTTGGTVSYFGSFTVSAISLSVTPTAVTIMGTADMTWATPYNRARITIPRVSLLSPPAAATLRWFNAASSPGATYSCSYASRYLRSISLEQDCETGITPFSDYNTGSLPSGGAARNLSVSSAYAEAGIEMAVAGAPNLVPAAPGGTWDNSELHNAMVNHFSLWQDQPQWKVWLFHASRYVEPGVLGIMFDQHGKQRQGCACFYKHPLMNGATATHKRTQLYCCVHELGHCFNLFHSFHKQYMTPPMPNRPGALSWMNYPRNYAPSGTPGGEAAFWAAFPFQFDDLETIHLRHSFRNNVIMGGNPFGTGAALEALAEFDDPVEDNSGLKLEIRTDRVFRFGEPVNVEIKLATAGGLKQVHRHLHPDTTFVRLAIQKPGGTVIMHEPILEQCVAVETTRLTPERPALYENAYIGFGKEGVIFDQPGIYRVRALYAALDGSQVVSNTLEIRVRAPLNEADNAVAELLLGEEQGLLFYLLGSGSEHLEQGNAALQEVEEKYGTHPLAIYATQVLGLAAARPFKNLTPEGKLTARKPNLEQAAKLLDTITEPPKKEKGRGLNNIALSQTLCRFARAQKDTGDNRAAEETIKNMVSLFKAKGLKAHIIASIEAQGKSALRDEPDQR